MMDNLIASIPGIVDRMYIEGWNTHEIGDLRRDLYETYADLRRRMERGSADDPMPDGDPETNGREVYP